MSSMEEGSDSSPKQKLSCTKCFDALWFCYCNAQSKEHKMFVLVHVMILCLIKALNIISAAPVHQMQQYYRLGVLDNCHEKWSALADCLMLKTKRASDVQVSSFSPRVLLAVDVFATNQTLVDKCSSQHYPPLSTYQRLKRRKEDESESVMQFFRKAEDLNFE